jgi:tetratricopeptide (TPR) repeat protein
LAQKSFEEALKKPGEHTSAKLILAELYIRQKEYRVAYGMLEQVNENDLRTKPQQQVYLHFKKGVILDILGGREKFAKEEYEKCLKVDPKCVGAMANLSRILTQDKATVKDAIKYAEQAVQLKADSDDLQQILGRAYYADGQYDKCIVALQKARALDKNAPVAYHLGMALKQAGKKYEAIKELTPLLDNKDFSKKDEVKKAIEELKK